MHILKSLKICFDSARAGASELISKCTNFPMGYAFKTGELEFAGRIFSYLALCKEDRTPAFKMESCSLGAI